MKEITCVILISFFSVSFASLGGPFVFWGPKELSSYRRPALKSLDQDDLIEIFENQGAIVVFNNQDSVPLTSDSFPRLRKLLERKTSLVLPQDFLDIHPEYINNETQIITVQGPNSERDAEITETFDRLEDIYGEGKVLGVMGSWSGDDDKVRVRREADQEPGTTTDEEGVLKEAPAEVVYNASGKIILYASDYLILRYTGSNNKVENEVKLRHLVQLKSDYREQQLYSRLILTFVEGEQKEKYILRFRFPESGGYWTIGSVDLIDPKGNEQSLTPKPLGCFMGAPLGFSFKCSHTLHFQNGSVSLIIPEIQVQPRIQVSKRFGLSYNCVGFMTAPIWSGIIITFLVIGGTFLGIIMISNIKTMDKFENAKGKVLTFTISE